MKKLVEEDLLRELVREALERRKQAFVYGIARKFVDAGLLAESLSVSDQIVLEEDWEKVASLSQLRSIVGGRFQNLKQRWIEAGFPLREHRGDRSQQAEIKESGWLELSLWITKQGYEVRPLASGEGGLFEIRKILTEG